MKFKINEMQTVKGGTRLYVDVEFIDGGKTVHRNDFVMEVQPTYRVYVGELGPEGEVLDPKAYETHDTDVAQEILGNIRRYVARSAMVKKDNRDRRIPIEDTDPLGLRAKPEVAALIGAEIVA